MKFWIDGELVPAARATVSVLDHGFLVGDGVFETLKTVRGPHGEAVPFAADRHIARLGQSARGLGLPQPDPDLVDRAMAEVCQANPQLADGGRMRVTYTSGAGPLGSDRDSGATTLAVAVSGATTWPPSTVLAISPWPRNERSPLTGVKSTSYADNVLMLAAAKALGAGEALLVNMAGNVCEGTGSNVFLVRGSHVLTAPLSSGCLAGITRGLVIEWGRQAGVDIVEQDVAMAELGCMDEVFLTSSTRDVHPVSAVLDAQGQTIWKRPPGPVTANLREVFARSAGADPNPAVR